MSSSDGNSVCRACLDCSEDLESLEEENEMGITLKDMLLSFCSIRLNEESTSMYNVICKGCSLETLRAYNFKLKCEQNDIILMEKLQSLKAEDVKLLDLKEEDTYTLPVKDESDAILLNIKLENNFDYEDVDNFDSDFITYKDCTDVSYNKKAKRKKEKKSGNVKSERLASNKHNKKSLIKYLDSNQNDDDVEQKMKDLTRKPGRPGRKKKVLPEAEAIFLDDSASTLGYKRIYECPKCNAFFKTFRMIHKHMIKLHQITLDGVYHFNKLWEAVRTTDEKETPEEKALVLDFKNPQYKCLDCSHTCLNFEIMRKHIINEHRGERFIHCDECEYTTTHLTMFVRHKRMHSGERHFACNECEYKSASNYQLNLHIAAHHTLHRAFVCDVCAQAFKTKLSLLNHIARVHVNKREHICPICQKAFNMKKDLKSHTLIHSGQRPHVCEHCGIAFTQKANLEKHVHVIHQNTGERPFACSQCDYKAKSVYSLKSHMYRHNRTKHYLCHLCTHKATTKYALKVHIQRHLGAKNHHCKSCSYSCYDAQTLIVHNRIHTGERPFPCGLCPYRSRTKQRLRNHMKSHLNEQKYSCQHCPYRSNYKSNLIVHLKKNCGKDSRPYTPRKNPGLYTLLPVTIVSSLNCVETQDRPSDIQLVNCEIEGQLKVELNINNTLTIE